MVSVFSLILDFIFLWIILATYSYYWITETSWYISDENLDLNILCK